MPNQAGSKSDFFYNLLEVLLRKISIDEESEEYKQLIVEENILWANATDDDLEKYIRRSAKMVKGNQRLRLWFARKKRDKAKKAVAENS